jgi:hypothetical protein
MTGSFQEKLTNMEAENQLLRQQGLLHSPMRTISESTSPKSVRGLYMSRASVHPSSCYCLHASFERKPRSPFFFFICRCFTFLLLTNFLGPSSLQNLANGSPRIEEQMVRSIMQYVKSLNCLFLCLNLKWSFLPRHLMALLEHPRIMGASHSLGHPFLRGSMYIEFIYLNV